jgi:hypothetical protein
VDLPKIIVADEYDCVAAESWLAKVSEFVHVLGDSNASG